MDVVFAFDWRRFGVISCQSMAPLKLSPGDPKFPVWRGGRDRPPEDFYNNDPYGEEEIRDLSADADGRDPQRVDQTIFNEVSPDIGAFRLSRGVSSTGTGPSPHRLSRRSAGGKEPRWFELRRKGDRSCTFAGVRSAGRGPSPTIKPARMRAWGARAAQHAPDTIP